MRIGIGGRLGPLRLGISTRGMGIGLGPLHVSTGYRRRRRRGPRRRSTARGGGSGSGGGALLIGGVLLLLVLFSPYLLGTWLAVQAGAGMHSATRSLAGWGCELTAVVAVVVIGVTSSQRSHAHQAERQRQERRQQLVAQGNLLRAQLGEVEALAQCIQAEPAGIADPRIKPKERLLADYDAVSLMEPRSVRRGGPKLATAVDMGTVLVTDKAVRFHGATKTVEWRYDRMAAIREHQGAMMFTVTNRQLVSGIRPRREQNLAVFAAIGWASDHAGAGDPATSRGQLDGLRDQLALTLQQVEAALTDAPGLGQPSAATAASAGS